MANPPITIGPFANVPAPGSPIRSDWAQQITNYVTGLAGAATALPAVFTGPVGGGTITSTAVTVGTLNIAATTRRRLIVVAAWALINYAATSGDQFDFKVTNVDAVQKFARGMAGTILPAPIWGGFLAANASGTITATAQKIAGLDRPIVDGQIVAFALPA